MKRLTGRNEQGDLLLMGEQVYAGDDYEAAVSALEGYEDAMENGTSIRLPCDPDEKCFVIGSFNCEVRDCPMKDESGDCNHECPTIIYEICPNDYTFGELIGWTFYKTREEAEAASKKGTE